VGVVVAVPAFPRAIADLVVSSSVVVHWAQRLRLRF
jgi:hypothetical protein